MEVLETLRIERAWERDRKFVYCTISFDCLLSGIVITSREGLLSRKIR